MNYVCESIRHTRDQVELQFEQTDGEGRQYTEVCGVKEVRFNSIQF